MLQQNPFFLQVKRISEETTFSITKNTGEKHSLCSSKTLNF